jgi:hypothetical protein|tara:strand:+ start:1972 stop:2316 length:345 start_codon:yes stop_codon:yes gene_type:complete
VDEVSYRITTDDGHFDGAERLFPDVEHDDLDEAHIDVHAEGFKHSPTVEDLAGFVQSALEGRLGTEGCANAFLTIQKQIKDKADAQAVAEGKAAAHPVNDYEVDGFIVDDDEDE